MELTEKYEGRWTREVIIENKEILLKLNHIVVSRVMELFTFAMPRAMILDEVEQWFFKFNFSGAGLSAKKPTEVVEKRPR